jgi:hypothetical protein
MHGKKQVVSNTPFVGYERAYRTHIPQPEQNNTNNTNNTNIDTARTCNEPVAVAVAIVTATATSMSLPASVSNPFAMFKNPNAPNAPSPSSSSGMTHPVTTPPSAAPPP